MPFPTFEQYVDALQFPSKVLKDPELAAAKVETTGMGLPFARTGGFAVTFKLIGQNKSWALRLFQKNRDGDKLGERYGAISRAIRNSALPYFVEFSFLPAGISIQAQTYSCVKMGWAEGVVLGTYIEKNRRDKEMLQKLRQSIQKLSADMNRAGLAHGDLQTDNLLVSSGGSLKFVDYDAFYAPEIKNLGAIEVGYPSFQHPEREKLRPYDEKLDRFSFLVIDSALHTLLVNPSLWEKVGADPQCLLVRASDFAAPHASVAFHTLALDPQVGTTYKRLAAICEGKYQDVPTLGEFLAGKGPSALNLRPISSFVRQPTISQVFTTAYQSRASKVLPGDNYSLVLQNAGQHVEIIGKVLSADPRKTKYGKPFVHILFGPKEGKAVYIPVWKEGLAKLSAAGFRVDSTLVGKWVSVTGFVDATFSYPTWQRTGITVAEANMISVITEQEAKYRLASNNTASKNKNFVQSPPSAVMNKNSQIAAAAKKAVLVPTPSYSPPTGLRTQNVKKQRKGFFQGLWDLFFG